MQMTLSGCVFVAFLMSWPGVKRVPQMMVTSQQQVESLFRSMELREESVVQPNGWGTCICLYQRSCSTLEALEARTWIMACPYVVGDKERVGRGASNHYDVAFKPLDMEIRGHGCSIAVFNSRNHTWGTSSACMVLSDRRDSCWIAPLFVVEELCHASSRSLFEGR